MLWQQTYKPIQAMNNLLTKSKKLTQSSLTNAKM